MASLKNAIKSVTNSKAHRERAQPANRARFGLLEKKKDYVQRAKNWHKKEDRMRALQEKAALRNPDEFYMKTREEMEQLFPDHPEALDLTVDIAERCNVELDKTLHFPTFDTPDRMPEEDYLTQVAHEGISRLYNIPDPANPQDDREREVMERFDFEFGIIKQTKFINYFLVVWDFVHYAHQQDIPVVSLGT